MSKFFVLMLLAYCASFAQGQHEGLVTETEGVQHLLHHVDPVYPPIAKAAHVQGNVVLHVKVDEHGAVISALVIGGPPLLLGSALEAVKQWTYRPFERDSSPAAVTVFVGVPFSLGIPAASEKRDAVIAEAFFPKDSECRAANASGHPSDAKKACGDLVAIANRFPDPSQRANEIRSALEQYGQALVHSGDASSGLAEFRKATAIAEKSLTAKDEEYATAYFLQASAEHTLRMLTEAEQDYVTAEASYRLAMQHQPEMKFYRLELARCLAYHSLLASQTGHEEAGAGMRAEALSLNPHVLDGNKSPGR